MIVGVVGIGSIGSTIAKDLSAAGVDVIVASSDEAASQRFADTLGEHASAAPTAEAIRRADVVVFAVWLDVTRELIAENRDALAGKIVVDPSNPIAPDGKGGFIKTIDADGSSGLIVKGLLPEGARLVKAFGSLSADSLRERSGETPPVVLFFATDDPDAAAVATELIDRAGFDPVAIGGIERSIRIEVFGDLHEFGALGRAVTRPAALDARGAI